MPRNRTTARMTFGPYPPKRQAQAQELAERKEGDEAAKKRRKKEEKTDGREDGPLMQEARKRRSARKKKDKHGAAKLARELLDIEAEEEDETMSDNANESELTK
ncbi:hypothetical protein VNI00_010695 [Paramarasmius palmivorus]|uniref:Uncharacterized protein n=1 Tax=Paramarasmius palmivorus TaxID=297713 RepID=A0AAW0CCB5_9AGAR